jgi:hypothetical protein
MSAAVTSSVNEALRVEWGSYPADPDFIVLADP